MAKEIARSGGRCGGACLPALGLLERQWCQRWLISAGLHQQLDGVFASLAYKMLAVATVSRPSASRPGGAGRTTFSLGGGA